MLRRARQISAHQKVIVPVHSEATPFRAFNYIHVHFAGSLTFAARSLLGVLQVISMHTLTAYPPPHLQRHLFMRL